MYLYKLKNILKHCCPFQRYVCNFFQYRLKTRNRARSVAFLDLKMMSFFVILIILFLLFFELLVGLPPFYQNFYSILHFTQKSTTVSDALLLVYYAISIQKSRLFHFKKRVIIKFFIWWITLVWRFETKQKICTRKFEYSLRKEFWIYEKCQKVCIPQW